MPMGLFTLFDPVYWLFLGPAILFTIYAQFKVKAAYGHYSRVANSAGLTGAQAAREMLRREGLNDVQVEETQGWLSDHYDPRDRTLRLSPGVYRSPSVAAVGIACHEAGHALQHAHAYAFLGLRNALVPVAGIGSWLAWPIIIGGILFGSLGLAKVGLVLFAAIVAFQFITLPVEYNASSRAKDALVRNGVLSRAEEVDGASKVLNAAALTYVAATLAALAQLLYWALRLGMLGGDE